MLHVVVNGENGSANKTDNKIKKELPFKER